MKKLTTIALCLMAGTALAQAPGESTAWKVSDCDHACLSKFATDYMGALAVRDARRLKVQPGVRFTENDVELPFGKEGLWATATGVAPSGMIAADAQTGQVAWIGTAEENGKPVYFALRLAVHEHAIAEAETVVVRNTGLPLPFGDASKVVHDRVLQRHPAARAAPLARATARGGRRLFQHRGAQRRQRVHAL